MACACQESKKPVKERNWRIIEYKHQHQRPNGTKSARPIKSALSTIRCDSCGDMWRTSAKYVDELPGFRTCLCSTR